MGDATSTHGRRYLFWEYGVDEPDHESWLGEWCSGLYGLFWICRFLRDGGISTGSAGGLSKNIVHTY